MRKIKFQVWFPEHKTTVTGYEHDDFDYFVSQRGTLGYLGETEIVEEENAVIRLSTGLKDKNGDEIYEGDIVRHRDPGGIMSRPGESIFQVKQEESARYLSFGCLAGKNEHEIEVIGNIYENPELLKVIP